MSKKEAPKPADGDAAAPAKKSPMGLIIVAVVCLALGGGGASAYFLMMHKPAAPAEEEHAPEPEAEKAPNELIKIERMMVPMINGEGRLVRYASVDLMLEVTAQDRAEVDMNSALVRAGITRRMSRESVISKTDEDLIDYDHAGKLLTEAANEGLGKPLVIRAIITSVVGV